MIRKLEFIGLPGSGKSSVAAALSRRTAWPFIEEYVAENPFLAEVSATGALAFENCMFFLLSRQRVMLPNLSASIYDSGLFLDLAYARISLAGEELALYTRNFEHCLARSAPFTTIFLEVAPPVALERMRSRDGHSRFDAAGLQHLRDEILLIMHEFAARGFLTIACGADTAETLSAMIAERLALPPLASGG